MGFNNNNIGTGMNTKTWADNSFEDWLYDKYYDAYTSNQDKNDSHFYVKSDNVTKPMRKGFMFYKGMKVEHKTFGIGIVVDIIKSVVAGKINVCLKLKFKDRDCKLDLQKVLDNRDLIKQLSIFRIDWNDITNLDCDAIVNAANCELIGGGGVDGAIHRAAGAELDEACKLLNGCAVGEAKITKGFKLKAKYIIHTVGPEYGYDENCAALLAKCYVNSLEIAKSNDIHTIAFPAISTGIYGYPIKEATEIAINSVIKWVGENIEYAIKVIFCCYSREDFDVYVDVAKAYKTKNSYAEK